MADTKRDPSEVVSDIDRERDDPNFPGRKVLQRVITYADGRQEVWQRQQGQDPEKFGALISKGVDPDQKKVWDSNTEADTKAKREEGLNTRQEARDKATEQRQDKQLEYQRTRDAATERRAAQTDRRAASRDEILAKGQALQVEIAAGRLKKEQAQQDFDQWMKLNVEIPNEQARIAIAQSNSALANKREERAATSQEEQAVINRAKYYQGAEDDAVTQAYKNASNTVAPGFGERAAAQLNAYAGPGFNARPEDFVYRMPDEEAVRAKARERAAALMAYAGGIPPVGGAPTAPVAAPPGQPPPIPAYTPQMPGPFGR